jgi:hypothetical protein
MNRYFVISVAALALAIGVPAASSSQGAAPSAPAVKGANDHQSSTATSVEHAACIDHAQASYNLCLYKAGPPNSKVLCHRMYTLAMERCGTP